MAKKKTNKTSRPQKVSQASFVTHYIGRHPNFVPLAILLLLLLIFFNEVIFGGKAFVSADSLASSSIRPFVQDALKRGIYPLWNPYIFSGMPSFASLQSAPFIDLLGDIILGIQWILSKIFPLADFTRTLLNYFLFGLFAYLLLQKKTGWRVAALFCALALVFQPQVVSFAVFGHGTKLTTVVLIPLIFLLLDELLQTPARRERYFALLALAVGVQLLRAHTQMAYYTFMMIGIYLLFWLVESYLQKRSLKNVFVSLALVAGALVVGAAMSAVLYLPVQEYAHYSIRGGGTGLDYEYATNWSFSPAEIITFFVPSFMGFGGQTYWGAMPFTDFPFYMGSVTLLLAGLALVIRRDRYVIFFSILAVLSLVIAFGKHLPILYGPLFKFLPFFNKFRVPSMILILTAFSVVVLAGMGLQALIRITNYGLRFSILIKKYIYIFVAFGVLVALFFLFGKNLYLGWVSASAKPLAPAAVELAYERATFDAIKLAALLAVSGFLMLYFLKGKIQADTLGGLLIVLLVSDLWLVDFKINQPQPKQERENYFAETAAVKFLKTQKGVEPFRIFPAYDDKPENWYVYHFLQNIRGYHAAKLKIYQEFIEETGFDARNRLRFPPLLEKYFNVVTNDGQPAIQLVTPDRLPPERLQADNAVMDMLNVKYVLSYYPIPDPRYKPVFEGRPAVFENTGALPRAFFVNEIKVIPQKDEFFRYLRSGEFNPAREAILEEEPPFDIESSEENRVEVTAYDIHEIRLRAHAAKRALLVLSEIYYPAGWKALVDGKETKIYKTNYILRSILLEPGEHEIKFVFESKTFKLGLWITFSILFILLVMLVLSLRKRTPVANVDA
jgi:hypothetical protein